MRTALFAEESSRGAGGKVVGGESVVRAAKPRQAHEVRLPAEPAEQARRFASGEARSKGGFAAPRTSSL